MNSKTIDAVFFDMDETLIEHHQTGEELIRATFRAFAHRLEGIHEDKFATMLWHKANDLWQMMFDGVLSGEVARPYTFINTLRAFKADDALAHDMLEDFEQRMVQATRLMPGALEVMDTLRDAGKVVGVVTNGYTLMQMRKVEAHLIHEHADFVIVSEQVDSHKPHPDIFHEAVRRAGTSPERALFVGDNLDADIAGANAVGIGTVLIDPRGERAKRIAVDEDCPRPDYVIADLPEVLRLAGLSADVARARS
ncbi:MAG: HAD family hydrolase [Candidatus Hydrogenedentales bacterium]